VRDRAELGAIFTHLCEKLAEDLQRKGYVGKTIGIKLRYDDFKIATRDQTIDRFTDDGKTIRQVGGLCLKRVPLERPLRLLGVRVGALAKAGSPEALAPAGTTANRAGAEQASTTASLF
jgi:DNA polymerase-4